MPSTGRTVPTVRLDLRIRATAVRTSQRDSASATGVFYVALPGGQFSSELNGVGIVVLDVDRNFEFVKRIPTWNVPASISPEEVSGVAASPATNMIYLATRGRLAAFDLGADKKAWENNL
jgi:hypothetical protein